MKTKGWMTFRSSSPLKIIKNHPDSSLVKRKAVNYNKLFDFSEKQTIPSHREKMKPPILLGSKMTNSVSPCQRTDHTIRFCFSGVVWSLVIKRKATKRNLGSPKASTTGEKKLCWFNWKQNLDISLCFSHSYLFSPTSLPLMCIIYSLPTPASFSLNHIFPQGFVMCLFQEHFVFQFVWCIIPVWMR